MLTLNRPDQLNPLDHDTIHALVPALDETLAERASTVVVDHRRGQAFSAGGDLKAYQDLYRDRRPFRPRSSTTSPRCATGLEQGPLVSIAMVNGACLAGGLELALAATS